MREDARRVLVCLFCVWVSFTAVPAHALDSLKTTSHEIVGAMVGVGVAVGVGVGFGVYYATHPTIKGCVSEGPGGLQLKNDKDQKIYSLTGATTDVKAGEVVSLRGKKKSAKGASTADFFWVEKVGKSSGTCSSSPQPAL